MWAGTRIGRGRETLIYIIIDNNISRYIDISILIY